MSPDEARIEALAEKLYLAYWAPALVIPPSWKEELESTKASWRSAARRVLQDDTETQRRDLEGEQAELERLMSEKASLISAMSVLHGRIAYYADSKSDIPADRAASMRDDIRTSLDAIFSSMTNAADYDRKTEALKDEADAARSESPEAK